MDSESLNKISNLIEYIESLNDNRYYNKRRAKALDEISMLIQQEITKAKIDENNRWRTILVPSDDYNTADMEDFNDRVVELKQELEKL